jgi:hypothetical protein
VKGSGSHQSFGSCIRDFQRVLMVTLGAYCSQYEGAQSAQDRVPYGTPTEIPDDDRIRNRFTSCK